MGSLYSTDLLHVLRVIFVAIFRIFDVWLSISVFFFFFFFHIFFTLFERKLRLIGLSAKISHFNGMFYQGHMRLNDTNFVFCCFHFVYISRCVTHWRFLNIVSWNSYIKRLFGWHKPKFDFSKLIWDFRYFPTLAPNTQLLSFGLLFNQENKAEMGLLQGGWRLPDL